METNNVLTKFKRVHYIIILLLFTVVLAGCGIDNTPIDSSTTGVFDHYLVYPFSLLIKKFASIFGGYGISIIIITLAIRLILLPFTIKQTKNSQQSQDKMKVIKPEMDLIQKKYKADKSKEGQLEMQKELTALYKKHDYNPLSMAAGCMPMLIQFPFLIAFYYAIRRTPEISAESFLWIDLGQTDIILVAIAVICYSLQSWVTTIGLPAAQKKQMAFMGLISPIMIGIVSLNVPAALPLYWTISSIFMVIQTYFIKIFISKKQDQLNQNEPSLQ